MKRGTKLDGKSPMLLYAYGSYGASMTPNFSTARLSLVDRGMIYAIAHIRGGSELGEKWRQDGRMFKKMNIFMTLSIRQNGSSQTSTPRPTA
jgi:oligopeptidase B